MRAILALVLVGCGADVAMVRPPAIRVGEPLVFLGLDFTAAEFTDPYFKPADLVNAKIPQWNTAVSSDAIERLRDLAVQLDLRATAARNLAINPLAPVTRDFDPAHVREEVAPYTDASANGKGIIIIVERVSKRRGVWAHAVVFDRKSGEPLLVARSSKAGDGFGVYHFYWTALTKVVARCANTISHNVGSEEQAQR